MLGFGMPEMIMIAVILGIVALIVVFKKSGGQQPSQQSNYIPSDNNTSDFSQSTPTGIPASPDTKDLLRFEGEKKSAGVALFLCWVLGAFGGHRFYMGRKGSAATILIITLLSIPLCFIVVGFFTMAAVYIMVMVDLFSVSGWVREYNRTLLAKIQTGQG